MYSIVSCCPNQIEARQGLQKHHFSDNVQTAMEPRLSHLIEVLRSNNISACYVGNRHQACAEVKALIPEGSVVGFGDSLTLRQIGVVQMLESGNYTFLNPWKPGTSTAESLRLKRRALTSDVFVTGTNAVTLGGQLVNVDGHGNRAAAMLFGPEKVVIVVGINKIVSNLKEAFDRIRRIAAPRNVSRHPEFHPPPPCAASGECSDCTAAWRICNKTVIIQRQYANDRYHPVLSLVLVGEALGL